MPGAIVGALSAVLIFLIAAELFGVEVALIAAALWAFDPSAIGFNRVAKEVGMTHPHAKVLNCAYGVYTLPPLKIDKLEPNVLVGIVGSLLGSWAAGLLGIAPGGILRFVVAVIGAALLIIDAFREKRAP